MHIIPNTTSFTKINTTFPVLQAYTAFLTSCTHYSTPFCDNLLSLSSKKSILIYIQFSSRCFPFLQPIFLSTRFFPLEWESQFRRIFQLIQAFAVVAVCVCRAEEEKRGKKTSRQTN